VVAQTLAAKKKKKKKKKRKRKRKNLHVSLKAPEEMSEAPVRYLVFSSALKSRAIPTSSIHSEL
jgi:2'-5' RNA ligase